MQRPHSATRLALLGIALVLAIAGGLWLAQLFKRNREENAAENPPANPGEISGAPYSRKELQSLIQKLSSASEQDRKQAEQELARAGAFADEELNAAEAAAAGAAKEAIKRLRNRVRFSALQELDYLKAMPADSIVVLNARALQETFELAKKTALGRLVQRPAFDFLRKYLAYLLQRQNFSDLPIDYVKGQLALAMFQTTPGNIETHAKYGALVELKGADPNGEYLELSEKLLKAGGSIAAYNNIECIEAGPGKPAYARTGRNIIFGDEAPSLHVLLDTILNGPGIGANEDVQKIRQAQPKEPDLQAFIDLPALLHQALLYGGAGGQQAEQAFLSMMLTKLGYAGLSSRCLGDGFEDRLIAILPEGPTAIASALTAPAEGAPPLELLEVVPANAMVALISYIDGARLEREAQGYFNELKKIKGMPDLPDLFAFLREIERGLGVKSGELLGHLKGEAGLWLTPKPGAPWDQPDVCGVLTAPDERKAEELAVVLDKLNGGQPAGVFTKETYNKRLLRSVNQARNGDAGTGLNYAVEGKRLYLAASAQALKKQLDGLDRRATGLLKRDPLQKALKEFSAEERRGTVLYVDMQSVLTQVAEARLPEAQVDPTTSPEIKDALSKLPPAVDLFKDFPPLVALTVTRKDRAELIVHSPVPLFPLTAAIVILKGLESKKEITPGPKGK